jgi:hypothetical protein
LSKPNPVWLKSELLVVSTIELIMGKPLTDLTFEQWLMFVFDHPVDESKLEWYWDINADWWDGPNTTTIQFLTQAFENSTEVFQLFTDAEVNQGLWYLVSNACSNHILSLLDFSVPWKHRQHCIRSMISLYQNCFASRCTPHLSHIDEPEAGPLNRVCYMWWDIIPIYGMPNDKVRTDMDQEILHVMEATLQLDSVACRESSLHGLGHWQLYYPTQVQNIIDAFLQKHTNLRDELRSYALQARRGYVL